MLKTIIEKAGEKNLSVEFYNGFGLYMFSIKNSDSDIYEYGSSDYLDMVQQLIKMVDVVGDKEKEEALYQEILNSEM